MRLTLERVVTYRNTSLWLPWKVWRQVLVTYEGVGPLAAEVPMSGWLQRACPTVTHARLFGMAYVLCITGGGRRPFTVPIVVHPSEVN